jgi:hypothetical protein
MKGYILVDAQGTQLGAVEVTTPGQLWDAADGEAWLETPIPVADWVVELFDGELVLMPRVIPASQLLQVAKRDRLNFIRAARSRVEYAPFIWNGSRFDADTASQARLMGLVSLAQMALATSAPFAIDWTLADNTTRTLSAMDALGIGQALGAHVQAAHYTARELKQQVAAATTIEEVDAIAWPS